MAEFPIMPGETALLFFDCLNGDLHSEDPEKIKYVEGVVPELIKVNQACREAGIAVFYTQPETRFNDRELVSQVVDLGINGKPDDGIGPRLTTSGGGSRPPHITEIIPEIAPKPGDYLVRKKRWSAFAHTHLDLGLRTAGINTIIMAGGGLRVGIASTAYWAREFDYSLIVLRDATWSIYGAQHNPREVHEFFLQELFPVFARVRTVDEVIRLIEKE